jgi:hypothetical protein
VPLFWLTYGILTAALRAWSSPAAFFTLGSRPRWLADRGLEFASGHQLYPLSVELIPANMIGRFLDDGNLRKLRKMLIKKRPPAPSLRRGTATKAQGAQTPPP